MPIVKEFMKEKVYLTSREKDIIIKGRWLEDEHMEKFGTLVRNWSTYVPQEPWKVQLPHHIEPIPEDKEHIQIKNIYQVLELIRSVLQEMAQVVHNCNTRIIRCSLLLDTSARRSTFD